ncbi:MAG: rod shape-determining protein MreC [Firmicutes bacterium]|nr:rod shape-determining protein MreC [Bacillota bacterium]
MNFLEEYKKQIIIIGAVLLIICSILTFGERHMASFPESALGIIINPVTGFFTGIKNAFEGFADKAHMGASEEIAALKEENARLNAEIDRILLYEEENKRLANLLETKQRFPDYEMEGIGITGRDPGNWQHMFLLDKGEADDIHANMPLITADGLMGRITMSGLTYSKAQTILDTGSSVSAMTARTGDTGIVRGDYALMEEGRCIMEYIDLSVDVQVGDIVITSHLSEIYPAGLTIGTVTEIYTDISGLTKNAIIQPAVDFEHLDTLLVITDVSGGEAEE